MTKNNSGYSLIYKIVSSWFTTLVLLSLLGLGAAFGTFIENDFGSNRARVLVYNSWWYELLLLFASINLLIIIYKTKMYQVKARLLLHLAFVVILFGAFLTRYFGLDGTMHIREGERSNTIVLADGELKTPFYIQLNDFTLTRYPGSRSPSEFSSDIRLIDEKKSNQFDAKIYMNNTFVYGGYKFFQTSYDRDEKGTLLSVNKDPGVEITYVGYALLFLGLLLNLFDKNSRFQFLIQKIKKMHIIAIFLPLFYFLANAPPVYAKPSEYVQEYLNEHRKNSLQLAEAFGTLVVQDPTGRMKPLDTQNREVLNKISGKSAWQGMNANQVILGMFSRPKLWKKVNIIKIKTPKLRTLLGVSKTQKLVSFMHFFNDNGQYKLTAEVEKASKLVPSRRGTFERDLLQTDERLNIVFMSYRGVLLTLFPLPKNKRNKWVDFKTMFYLIDDSDLQRSTSRLIDAAYNRNYNKGIEFIKDIQAFQSKFGKSVLPDSKKIKAEIWYNKTALFFRLSLAYIFFAFVLLIYGVGSMFYNKRVNIQLQKWVGILSFILFSIHTFGIALRWYVGGYTPLSNTYETMIYISYSAILASVMFFRKSTIALSAAFTVAGIFIFSAYLGEIDPEITNLVPVLKSYWLSIHVSVITASYGFFGVGAMLGIITLFLFIMKSQLRPHIETHIQNLNYINEAALTLGLTLLVIGNFLGGIWANESWGRYWGWDPKETWAYISIIVYVIVIHLRLIKQIYSAYLFSVVSVLAFSSILMTYFGVNFYLAGMHSYATGDPVPIPFWVYMSAAFVLILIVLAYPGKNKSIKQKA